MVCDLWWLEAHGFYLYDLDSPFSAKEVVFSPTLTEFLDVDSHVRLVTEKVLLYLFSTHILSALPAPQRGLGVSKECVQGDGYAGGPCARRR